MGLAALLSADNIVGLQNLLQRDLGVIQGRIEHSELPSRLLKNSFINRKEVQDREELSAERLSRAMLPDVCHRPRIVGGFRIVHRQQKRNEL